MIASRFVSLFTNKITENIVTALVITFLVWLLCMTFGCWVDDGSQPDYFSESKWIWNSEKGCNVTDDNYLIVYFDKFDTDSGIRWSKYIITEGVYNDCGTKGVLGEEGSHQRIEISKYSWSDGLSLRNPSVLTGYRTDNNTWVECE